MYCKCLFGTLDYSTEFVMPVTLVDRLPLPNLKVYTAGSVSLLSIAIYYALSATSDPNWRANVTQGRQEAMAEPGEIEAKLVMTPPPVVADNSTRNVSEQFVDVMTFMLQEPLCMWVSIFRFFSVVHWFNCFVCKEYIFPII